MKWKRFTPFESPCKTTHIRSFLSSLVITKIKNVIKTLVTVFAAKVRLFSKKICTLASWGLGHRNKTENGFHQSIQGVKIHIYMKFDCISWSVNLLKISFCQLFGGWDKICTKLSFELVHWLKMKNGFHHSSYLVKFYQNGGFGNCCV